MKLQNANQKPQVYYGLHMCEGVAEYADPGGSPYRIVINENALKTMDQTFQGLPVYVHHVDEVDFSKFEHEAAGVVIRSFFNTSDGKHWAEFVVFSDAGHEAIKSGWKLSNAYIPKGFAGGGLWHGVEYAKEVTSGEYEHLAIVQNPRYEESIILTPEQFKHYNSTKEVELVRMANSKKGDTSMSVLNIFKRTKVENAKDLEGMSVLLPKSNIEKTITQLVNEADEHAVEAGKPDHMANGEHHVLVGENKMTVNELVAKHSEMCNELAEMKAKHVDGKEGKEGEEPPPPADEKEKNAKDEEDKLAAEKKANEDKEAKEKKENEDKEAAEKKSNDLKLFNELKDADKVKNEKVAVVELASDQVQRGRNRYGSSK